MDIDFVEKKKNNITVSGFEVGSIDDLTTVHTAKPSIIWKATDGAFAWIKLNVYEMEVVNRIVLTYTGSITDITIERSLDTRNWEILSPTFVPETTSLDIAYTEPGDFIFIRVTVTDPLDFSLVQFEIYGPAEFENKDIISHNVFKMYSDKFRVNFPRLPEFTTQYFRMLEGNNDLDLRLFDSTIYETSSISKSPVGDVITFTPINIPVLNDSFYIWDFDEDLTTTDEDRALLDVNNPNIVIELAPAVKTYTYQKVGLHVARLIVVNPKYLLEFTNFFLKV